MFFSLYCMIMGVFMGTYSAAYYGLKRENSHAVCFWIGVATFLVGLVGTVEFLYPRWWTG